MSEAITKACETCAGKGSYPGMSRRDIDCVDCSGTGRVPDVEATLRAEVARLTAENARLAAEVERLKAELAEASATATNRLIELTDAEKRADWAEVEVERLKGRERQSRALLNAVRSSEFDGVIRDDIARTEGVEGMFDPNRPEQDALNWVDARSAWLAGCKS